MNYSRFSLLGYAPHAPHSYLGHRIVNPAAHVNSSKRENYSGLKSSRSSRSSKSKNVIEYKGVSDVPSFQNFLRDHPVAFVWFYAPWCGHCVAMEDAYNAVAEELSDSVSFIKVNADENTELCVQYKVSGYPTLKLFKNGKDSETYSGSRTADAFSQWLSQRV